MVKKIVSKLRSKIFQTVLSWVIIVLFGLSIFSIPTFSFLPKYYYLTWALTIVLILVSFAYIIFYKKLFFDLINLSLLAFLLSCFIGYVLNGFQGFKGTVFLNTFLIIVFYMLAIGESELKTKLYYSILLGITFFAFIYIVVYRDLLLAFNFSRLGDMFGDINDIAIVLSIGFCISFSLAMKKNQKWFVICLLLFLASILLLLSFSTGSKIVIFIDASVIILIVFSIFGKKRWYFSILILAGILVISIFVLNLPPFGSLKDRFLNMIYSFFGIRYKNMNYDLSTAIRVDMFIDGISMFFRRPLFGYGPSGFMEFSSYAGAWSHNHLSESLCNYGIIGTILYHFPLVVYFLKRKKSKNTFVENALMCCFFVSMISVALFGEKFFTYLFGLILSSSDITPLCEIKLFKETIYENN